ncbi:MAG: dCTP deaminase [Methanobacterium paludis]|nr:dCTP deaminase [Methanobacterium paludis]
MMLSDNDIIQRLANEEIISGKFKLHSIQPNSLDLYMKPQITDEYGTVVSRGNFKGTITIPSKKFVLATSKEFIELPDDLAGMLHTRSSIGRMGILTHTTAGLIDAGFKGEITFELFNCSDEIKQINLNEPIAQLTFHQLKTPAKLPYNGSYQGQKGITISKYLRGKS